MLDGDECKLDAARVFLKHRKVKELGQTKLIIAKIID